MSAFSKSVLPPQLEQPNHYAYLKNFRTEQCMMFLQHKCFGHRPFSCFNWHFQNQRRRRSFRKRDGHLNYSSEIYCTKYDESNGYCSDGDDCQFLHRNAGDTERRYHIRYYKTTMCSHDTDSRGICTRYGVHCANAHNVSDRRQPVYDIDAILAMEQSSTNLESNFGIDAAGGVGKLQYPGPLLADAEDSKERNQECAPNNEPHQQPTGTKSKNKKRRRRTSKALNSAKSDSAAGFEPIVDSQIQSQTVTEDNLKESLDQITNSDSGAVSKPNAETNSDSGKMNKPMAETNSDSGAVHKPIADPRVQMKVATKNTEDEIKVSVDSKQLENKGSSPSTVSSFSGGEENSSDPAEGEGAADDDSSPHDSRWKETSYVLLHYKTKECQQTPICVYGFNCPRYHSLRDRRRHLLTSSYKSNVCPTVRNEEDWLEPNSCELGDDCGFCHTRAEQQFHPEVYKSSKCNDVDSTGYCPRGPFCAFAHMEDSTSNEDKLVMENVVKAISPATSVTSMVELYSELAGSFSGLSSESSESSSKSDSSSGLTWSSSSGNSSVSSNEVLTKIAVSTNYSFISLSKPEIETATTDLDKSTANSEADVEISEAIQVRTGSSSPGEPPDETFVDSAIKSESNTNVSVQMTSPTPSVSTKSGRSPEFYRKMDQIRRELIEVEANALLSVSDKLKRKQMIYASYKDLMTGVPTTSAVSVSTSTPPDLGMPFQSSASLFSNIYSSGFKQTGVSLATPGYGMSNANLTQQQCFSSLQYYPSTTTGSKSSTDYIPPASFSAGHMVVGNYSLLNRSPTSPSSTDPVSNDLQALVAMGGMNSGRSSHCSGSSPFLNRTSISPYSMGDYTPPSSTSEGLQALVSMGDISCGRLSRCSITGETTHLFGVAIPPEGFKGVPREALKYLHSKLKMQTEQVEKALNSDVPTKCLVCNTEADTVALEPCLHIVCQTCVRGRKFCPSCYDPISGRVPVQ